MNNDALEIRKPIRLAKIAARRAGKILQDIRVGEYANASAQIPKRCIYHETKELDRSRKSSVHALWRIMFLAASIAGKRMIWRHRVGSRFAAAHPLPACGSTAELAQALNAYWQQMDWGYVQLADEPESLRIVHYCAPLHAFGDTALAWTPAFLEGVYQTWLSALGAQGLSVAQTSGYSENTAIEFRLGRHPV